MTTDHYELYCRVRDTKNMLYARRAAWFAGIGIIVSIISLIYSIVK